MNCRICEIEITKNILLEDIPISISELYDMKNQTLKTSDSKIYMCTNCGHNQIENLNELNYYEDYLMQVSHSKKINALQDQQIQKLLSYTKKVCPVFCHSPSTEELPDLVFTVILCEELLLSGLTKFWLIIRISRFIVL